MIFRRRALPAGASLVIGATLCVTLCAAKPLAVPAFSSGNRTSGEFTEPISTAYLAQDALNSKGPGPVKAFFELLLMAYREGLSPVDGPSCPFHPTCSGFARQAIRSHGLATGILMTGDRLMRCNGSGHDRYTRILPMGMLHDPPPP